MTTDSVQVEFFGDVVPKAGKNPRIPYQHQKMAMASLDEINQSSTYSTLVVLPTGGAKHILPLLGF